MEGVAMPAKAQQGAGKRGPLTAEQQTLVVDNLRLVPYVLKCMSIRSYYPHYEDCLSEGQRALCNAARYFDPQKAKFTTFAVRAIWVAVKKYLARTLFSCKEQLEQFELDLIPAPHEVTDDGSTATIKREVHAAIDRLPEPMSVWLRRRLRGELARDIARSEGVAESTVRDRLQKARAMLKRRCPELQELLYR